MADAARARKLAVRIKQVVAATLEMSVKDPRLAMVTVTDARVTPDLREATVFYTVYGDDAALIETRIALESAKGVVRSAVGRATGVKHTPSITWQPDLVPSAARHIDELLDVARAADAQVAAVRSTATPAGDPNPYREPRVAADDDTADGGAGSADVVSRTDGARAVHA